MGTSIKSMEASNENIPSELRGKEVINDDLLNSVGVYSKKDIEHARFHNYSRFGKIIDPYGRVNAGREYLFFVKPDLHLVRIDPNDESLKDVYNIYNIYKNFTGRGSPFTANGMTLNPQLNNYPYFRDLIEMHPDVVKELQYSIDGIDPFSHLLSFSVNSVLPLDGTDAKTLDNPSTIFGTTYNYLQDSEASDEAYNFSLEFTDNKNLDCYHFFKAYSEYHIARKSGLITPPSPNYWKYKRLHNTMGIYKFVVAEDMETLIYWAYIWGVYPKSCPREAFQDPTFHDGITFSVNFESSFIEDMNPMILYQFNKLMTPVLNQYGCDRNHWLPIVKNSTAQPISNSNDGIIANLDMNRRSSIIDGRLPIGAMVNKVKGEKDIPKYYLRWYAPPTK